MMKITAQDRQPTHRLVAAALARKAERFSRVAPIAHTIGQVTALNRAGVGRVPPSASSTWGSLPLPKMGRTSTAWMRPPCRYSSRFGEKRRAQGQTEFNRSGIISDYDRRWCLYAYSTLYYDPALGALGHVLHSRKTNHHAVPSGTDFGQCRTVEIPDFAE